MQPVPRHHSLVHETCARLRDSIASGELTGHLPGELGLCSHLQVSRATLRGALARLESEGLLRRGSQGQRREIVAPRRRPAAPTAPPPRVIILSPVAWGGLTAVKLLWIDELRKLLTARGLPLDFVVSGAAALRRPDRVLGELVPQHPGAVWLLLQSTGPMQQWFMTRQVPAVVAGSLSAGVTLPGVDSDYLSACRHAAGRLLARGCRRLGLIIPQTVLAGDRDSEAGFHAGAAPHPVMVARHDGTADGLSRTLDALMRSEPPHGLLVCHATHAVTVLGRLLLTGWQLPRDVKLLARDDDPFLQHVTPTLARYSVRPGAFAARLGRALAPWLDGGTPRPRAELLLPEFISGETL